MFLLAALLAAPTFLPLPNESLTLRSGTVVAEVGEAWVEGTNLLFRRKNGVLYSLPLAEIDLEATRRDSAHAVEAGGVNSQPAGIPIRGWVVSEEEKKRLLKKLEANHEGKPRKIELPPAKLPPPAREELTVEERLDERYWRDRARQLEENIRRRQEDLDLLVTRERALEDQIRSFYSLGYHPNQYSYQILSLQQARDSMDYARLEVQRAKREYDQFRDDARREGILPGWLR